MIDIHLVFGTRPEAIKLAPIILALKSQNKLSYRVTLTGQHREMTRGILDWFGVQPDEDLDIMEPDQTLSSLTANATRELAKAFTKTPAKVILTQGDTTSAFVASLVAFYQKSKVGHVEAGLRTFDKFNPWPEEINRKLITQLADWHFAPTSRNVVNLRNEGVTEENILKSGNTVIDALMFSVNKINTTRYHPSSLAAFFTGAHKADKLVLITGHRRENFGAPFQQVCTAIARLAKEYPSMQFVYPVHLNPNVGEPVRRLLGGLPNVHLIAPLPYADFVSLMQRSFIILTDSGGVQEEAPSLRKPVLVFRETTERPEAVEAGMVLIVGTDADSIVARFTGIVEQPEVYASMTKGENPYGDGRAAQRIVEFLGKRL